jgi:surfactin synthase thioesterase subunit
MGHTVAKALHFTVVTHFVDIAAGMLLKIGPWRSRIFPDGWGDHAILDLLSDPSILADPIPPADILWGRKEEHRGHRLTRGQFLSPSAPLLPPESRVVTFEQTEPSSGTAPLAILLPAWNDHGFEQRRTIASLLLEHGIGSLVFDVPLYGSRRVTDEREQAIRTVADFALMGFGGIRDALSLAEVLQRPHGFAGFSMGGNLAALAAAASPHPAAMAGLAASHSPGPVYLDGVLANAIVWDALGGRAAEPRLREFLTTASALQYEPRPHHRSAVLLAAESDGFVPFAAARALADHWSAEFRTLPGGHATALWRHRPAFARAIADAFRRLEASDA